MAFEFDADVITTREIPIQGGARYTPTLTFQSGDAAVRLAATIVDAPWPLAKNEENRVTFSALSAPELDLFFANLSNGDSFVMYEGVNEVGRGTVADVRGNLSSEETQ